MTAIATYYELVSDRRRLLARDDHGTLRRDPPLDADVAHKYRVREAAASFVTLLINSSSNMHA